MENYIPYEANEALPHTIHFENLYDDGDGLKITVISTSADGSAADSIIEIIFSRTFGHRSLDEGFRMRTYDLIKSFPKVSIFTVENSSFLQYFHEESMGAFRDFDLVHYYIDTTTDCIDVLSRVRPVISRKSL